MELYVNGLMYRAARRRSPSGSPHREALGLCRPREREPESIPGRLTRQGLVWVMEGCFDLLGVMNPAGRVPLEYPVRVQPRDARDLGPAAVRSS
jgi:hypothetical protein